MQSRGRSTLSGSILVLLCPGLPRPREQLHPKAPRRRWVLCRSGRTGALLDEDRALADEL